ncbi:kinase-like domain-containing protein [Rhizophagus irregularis DAOM 181602=DAOM 197198]|nr:kinase-like domain-containing protein [Rhizophagus irregularis DAOM 181602=DAOM 197198]
MILVDYLKKHFNNFTGDNNYNLGYQLASVVLCLHSEGIVHRDLKLKNVFREDPIPDTPKNYLKLYTVVDENCVIGINGIGHCYEYDIGIKRDLRRAAYLYKKAGNNVAQCNLAFMYLNGKGTYVNYNKAFELFKQLAEVKYLDGIIMLGYSSGLGDMLTQYNIYEEGDGIEKI